LSNKQKGYLTEGRCSIPLLKPWLVSPDQLWEDFKQICSNGRLSLGKFTQRLEERARKILGVKEAVAVSSGTSGLILLLRALGIKGKVVVPGFTFPATSHSVLWAGAKVKFCDVCEDDFTISVKELEKINDPDVEAVFAVNVFGLPPKIKELEEICEKKGWSLLFDSAQGLGARYNGRKTGGFGKAEVFSMSPSKVITAGEGGLITTNDTQLAEKLRSLRDYGKTKDDIAYLGLSARMSEFNALVAFHSLAHLEELVESRRQKALRYREELGEIAGISFQQGTKEQESGYNYFVIRLTEESFLSRDELWQGLLNEGIETKRYFYPPAHKISAYKSWSNSQLPVSEKLSESCLALPLYPELEEEKQEQIIKTIKKLMAEK